MKIKLDELLVEIGDELGIDLRKVYGRKSGMGDSKIISADGCTNKEYV